MLLWRSSEFIASRSIENWILRLKHPPPIFHEKFTLHSPSFFHFAGYIIIDKRYHFGILLNRYCFLQNEKKETRLTYWTIKNFKDSEVFQHMATLKYPRNAIAYGVTEHNGWRRRLLKIHVWTIVSRLRYTMLFFSANFTSIACGLA